MPSSDDTHIPQLTLAQLFAKFLRFGLLAFGGPVAQIALIRQTLVDEERWIAIQGAPAQLTFPGERALIERLLSKMACGR